MNQVILKSTYIPVRHLTRLMLSTFLPTHITICVIHPLIMAAYASVTAAYSANITSPFTVPAPDPPSTSSMNNSEDILSIIFEILAAVLAIASIILAYLQLVHVRKTPRVDGKEQIGLQWVSSRTLTKA